VPSGVLNDKSDAGILAYHIVFHAMACMRASTDFSMTEVGASFEYLGLYFTT